MKVNTKIFGTIDIEDSKIINFPNGIVGYPALKQFTLIKDEEKPDSLIMWLQSMDEGSFALPVMEPTSIIEDYNPTIDDEYLAPIGELKDEEVYALVTITVPSNVEEMTANLKAPVVINMATNKAVQIIVEDNYQVRQPIYDILVAKKEG